MTASTLTAPPTETQLITAEEIDALGISQPYELREGRIVLMTPTGDEHAEIESAIDGALGMFVRAHKLGKVYVGEVGILTGRDPDTVRGADVAFIARTRLRPRTGRFLAVSPDLVVEVISPGDTWREITDKLIEYFAAEVQIVWIVDPKLREVHVHTAPHTYVLYGFNDTIPGGTLLPGFALPVADIFEDGLEPSA